MASEEQNCSRQQRWSLEGMTALVTGGTKGIGYAIVEELAGFGAKVYTCSRNESELSERLKEWEIKGFKVKGFACDLSSRTQREDLIKHVSSEFVGKLNILINNAATTLLKHASEHSSEDYDRIMSTNLESPYHMCQLAYPLLQAASSTSAKNIVFISSVAGGVALPAMSAYAASKGAINQLTKSLACEWAKDNIRVNAVAPFGVRTNILKPEEVEMSILGALGRLMARTHVRRIAEADEISPMVAFLCLPAASYITGQENVMTMGSVALENEGFGLGKSGMGSGIDLVASEIEGGKGLASAIEGEKGFVLEIEGEKGYAEEIGVCRQEDIVNEKWLLFKKIEVETSAGP